MMKKLAVKAPNAPAYVGICVWDRDTNDLGELDSSMLRPIQTGRTNLPVLWESHWMGVELEVGPKFARATRTGFCDEHLEEFQRALARFLDVQPQHLQIELRHGKVIPNLCGWQLLVRWYDAAEAPLSWTHQHHMLGDITVAKQEMIKDVIHEEWDKFTQNSKLKTFAELLRGDFFIHRALIYFCDFSNICMVILLCYIIFILFV